MPFSKDLKKVIRSNVFPLGFVSFFTDFGSEMVYPLLPVFFKGLVSTSLVPLYVGLMDGIADSTASLLKIFSGRWSDKLKKRKIFVLSGYFLSSIARPILAIATAGWQVVFLRFIDRIGKGTRTSPRDALISESISKHIRGLAFSFQRAMDHAGAVAGPLFAMFLMMILGGKILWGSSQAVTSPEEMKILRLLFAITLIPGLLAVITIHAFVRENIAVKPEKSLSVFKESKLPRKFYLFLLSSGIFALGNSSDLFIIYLGVEKFSLGAQSVVFLWIILHLSKIIFSVPGGRLSDKIGRKILIICGWVLYSGVYAAFALANNVIFFIFVLFMYGLYYGLTEGAEKALIADIVPANLRGKGFGIYLGVTGLCLLPASIIFGVLWKLWGPLIPFFTGSILAFLSVIILTLFL